MSNVGDALSGSSGSGVTDTTLSDASLGDQMMGGGGDLGAGNASAFGDAGNNFNSFNDIANAFSGGAAGVGATPTAVQSASMTPPAAAGQTGGDPTGAAGGTQSNAAPGSSPDQNQQQQTGGGGKNQTQDPNYAPPQAVSQLKALLKQLNTGKPPGPSGPTPQGGQNAPFALPTLAAGQTGPQSPQMPLPSLAAGQTGPQTASLGPGFAGSQPGGAGDISTAALPSKDELQFDPTTGTYSLPPGGVSTDAQGNPVTAGGTRADQTPLPPPRPQAQTADAGGGRDITVKPKGGAQPPQTPPPTPTQPLPTKVPAPLPTKKPGPSPAPTAQGPATGSILRDISGVSTGSPTALADLAQAARIILPLAGMLMGGFGGGRRGGRFHGGRFTHGFGGGLSGFRGGMNAMGHLHQGNHPAGPGHWPYHHPQFGWHMHPRHPGPGWLPLNPMDAQGIVGGGQPQGQAGQDPNAPDPNAPPPETPGTGGGQPDDAFQKSGFSSNPFIDALVGQESGGGQNIVSRTDKDSHGLTAAQGGNPNEISQGYFQIQNHPGGTWTTYGRQAGIDLNKYPTPRSAPLDVQWQVASRIPIGQWGRDTQAILRQKFGNFDQRMTFGQIATQFGPAGGRLAAQKPSTQQPAWAAATPIPTTLPVTSQPMVSGG
jgi:hypothetical protein